ncbi:fatty acyl-AMP ligase [Nocardiopsis aegyptia]|uniref:Acyl-CoA synthetase (AMP-forming)/AMP-acid ligase II n=1 Tax=Nocardiopsis aegyptia TaxID=220378 RepID=A0A7Z0ET04_9ACTN|nr:fatty acyl-AMP ligase [Nocardiopsis aegyptia]NYJ37760.1 acyl-CoA synthetase (AMP-forming)/AMP-acid ligase II [Nocardiopsis aegyptia]
MATDTPTTLIDVLLRHTRTHPHRKAYEFTGGGTVANLTYAELERRSRSMAVALRASAAPGDRVLVMCSPGLDYVAAFLGALYAGVIAVPAYPPTNARNMVRLVRTAQDAQPVAVIADALVLDLIALHDTGGELAALHRIPVEDVPDTGADLPGPRPDADDVAFLQYTSGSTGTPKGVVVSHRNLMHNSALIASRMSISAESVCVSWLPPYHDMGLVGGILQPLHSGFLGVLMTPLDFLQRPMSWLEAVSEYRGTVSGGPDFAFELCSTRFDAQPREDLDLSSWSVAFSGSEPIRRRTLDRFAERFTSVGFRERAFFPCYGLAEATLLVSGGPVDSASVVMAAPVAPNTAPAAPAAPVAPAVPAASATPAVPDGAEREERPLLEEQPRFVECGGIPDEMDVRVADPATGALRAPGEVGEILVASASVAMGYWNGADEASFHARPPGTDRDYLRTGDLGFVRDGRLFVTSRLKDVLILRGRNHHPHDIEDTAAHSHPMVRPGAVAAFTTEVADQDRLMIVAEVRDGAGPESIEELTAALRRAVAEEHGLSVHTVVPIRARTAPKTANGKLQRHRCKELFLSGELAAVSAGATAKERV